MRAVTTPLPTGFRVTLDPATQRLADGSLFGGSPERIVRLTPAGQVAFAELAAGPVASRNAAVLARRLTDAGLVHPCPPDAETGPDVTVVVPVRDRAEPLARCLAGLGGRHPVVVVDDASRDPAAVAEVAARFGATLVRRDVNGGAGPARNTGLTRVTTELVAFVDSDCLPDDDWIDRLATHFADPLVAAVAPRVLDSALDLGDRPARVSPHARVSYVPTAALLVRRSALPDGGFDESIGRGEDVDLVWRMHEAGHRVRYDPSVVVRHTEPSTRSALVARRFRYGRSAAPLAVRHPTAIRPLVLHPWPALTVLAALARRPLAAAVGFCCSVVAMRTALRRAGVPPDGVPKAMAAATGQTWLAMGRYATQYAGPVLAVAALVPGRHRLSVVSLLLGPPVVAWCVDQSDRGVLDRLVDDISYGAGVWSGCLTARTLRPLRPTFSRKPLRVD